MAYNGSDSHIDKKSSIVYIYYKCNNTVYTLMEKEVSYYGENASYIATIPTEEQLQFIPYIKIIWLLTSNSATLRTFL